MIRRLLASLVLALVALALGLARPGLARDDARGFVVIVSPDNPISSIDRDFLREAWLRKATDWGDGVEIHPVDLSTKFPAREQFAREILKKTPAQLRSYWTQQIFSGKGVPPPEAATIDEVVAFVVATPGAIGYLPAGASPGKAKVVEVR